MEEKKVLILYASFGSGHGSAAEAVKEALLKKNIKAKSVDVLDFAFDIFKKSLPKAYSLIVSKTPLLYKWIYKYVCKEECKHYSNNNIKNIGNLMNIKTKMNFLVNNFWIFN